MSSRRIGRLFPMDRDPARGLVADRLPLGLSRERETLAHRRPPYPKERNAALLDRLLRQYRPFPRRDWRCIRPRGPSQTQARDVLARLEHATTNEIFKIGLHEFITAFVEDNDRLGETISEQYLLH